jgi:hypothetical protein
MTVQQLKAAFEAWENNQRSNPESFLSKEEVARMEVADISEQRALYMAGILRSQGIAVT